MASEPIKIDLRDLTDAHVAQALPHLGKCSYSAPCIIGTLLTQDARERFDKSSIIGLSSAVGGLIEDGLLTLPDEQRVLATALQRAFDSGKREAFDAQLAHVRGKLAEQVQS